MKTTTIAPFFTESDLLLEIDRVNAAHWKGDYNSPVQRSDISLRRSLAERATPMLNEALSRGLICMGEFGPCAMYAFRGEEASPEWTARFLAA